MRKEFSLIATVVIFSMCCEAPAMVEPEEISNSDQSSQAVDNLESPLIEVTSESDSTLQEIDPCYNPEEPPFDYDAALCVYTDHGTQCDWYVGPNGTDGCYESFVFYNSECVWTFQNDYCGKFIK